jgi:hypothetical protein
MNTLHQIHHDVNFRIAATTSSNLAQFRGDMTTFSGLFSVVVREYFFS